ncbi:hypothetical protein ABZ543_13390 [Streptomyces roseifaciens]
MAKESPAPEPATEDDVYAHMSSIPASLTECAAARHKWMPHDWTGYTSHGNVTKDPKKVAVAEITQRCQRCKLKRHLTYNRTTRSKEITGYSDRHPSLISPYGVSQTGISVRAQMDCEVLERQTFKIPVQVPPSGATKRRLKAVS